MHMTFEQLSLILRNNEEKRQGDKSKHYLFLVVLFFLKVTSGFTKIIPIFFMTQFETWDCLVDHR